MFFRMATKILEAVIKEKSITFSDLKEPVTFTASENSGGEKISICGHEVYVKKEDFLSGSIATGDKAEEDSITDKSRYFSKKYWKEFVLDII